MVDMTFSPGTQLVSCYLDGTLVATTTASAGTGSGNISHMDLGGISYGNSTSFFSGQIDDAAVFSRVLSANEIASLSSSTQLSGAQLQVEVEPAGVSFVNTPNVTSSPFVASGTIATTSYIGSSGNFHWQARAVDVLNNSSAWHIFNTSGTNSGQVELSNTPLYSDANLVNYYRLENANDSKGALNLTATGTVRYNSAMFNNGADLGANNSANALYSSSSYDGPLTMNVWVKLESPLSSSAGGNGGYMFMNTGKPANNVSYGIFT